MKLNNKAVHYTINDMSYKSIASFDKAYSFKNEMDELKDDEAAIIEKFLQNYLNKVYILCEAHKEEANIFMKWFEENGKRNLKPILGNVKYENINTKRLVRIFLRYDILLEQALYEKNGDALLNLLVDIPITINEKMQQWGCFCLETQIYTSDITSQYKSNKLEI